MNLGSRASKVVCLAYCFASYGWRCSGFSSFIRGCSAIIPPATASLVSKRLVRAQKTKPMEEAYGG